MNLVTNLDKSVTKLGPPYGVNPTMLLRTKLEPVQLFQPLLYQYIIILFPQEHVIKCI